MGQQGGSAILVGARPGWLAGWLAGLGPCVAVAAVYNVLQRLPATMPVTAVTTSAACRDLSNNALEGSVPASWTNLGNLTYL
jgi:hypothetical protein